MDRIERLYREHRGRLDTLEPRPDGWDRLAQRLPTKQLRWWTGRSAQFMLAATFALLVAGAGTLLYVGGSSGQPALAAGEVLPDLCLTDDAGCERRLSDIDADYTVVNFYSVRCATSCANNCNKLTPMYDDLRRQGFEIYGVALDRDLERWKTSLEKHQWPWVQVVDADGSVQRRFKLRNTPVYVLMDQNRCIIAVVDEVESLRREMSGCSTKCEEMVY